MFLPAAPASLVAPRRALWGLGILAACAPNEPPATTPTPSAVTPDASGLTPEEIAAEVTRLRAALASEVPQTADPAREADRLARAQRSFALSGPLLEAAELVVVVDRNPAAQELSILLARPDAPWEVLGSGTVSTGQAGRRAYFITPTGVFLHTDAILDWRARGTPNARGIRGLGSRGMRIWDFGWVPAERGWLSDGSTAPIRFLIHATDPDYLEPRLGQTASQGCVRISSAMNIFLDRQGVLDRDHERQAAAGNPRFRAVLHPERTPSPLAGRALVVVDSTEAV